MLELLAVMFVFVLINSVFILSKAMQEIQINEEILHEEMKELCQKVLQRLVFSKDYGLRKNFGISRRKINELFNLIEENRDQARKFLAVEPYDFYIEIGGDVVTCKEPFTELFTCEALATVEGENKAIKIKLGVCR